MIKRLLLLLILLKVTIVASAAGAPGADKPIDLFVGTQPFTTVFVAEKEGYFAKRGVNVRVHRFSSGTGATEAFRAAGAGLFVAGDMPSILAWEHGDVMGVAPVSNDTTTFSLVVGPGIKTAADVVGQKLATVQGSTGDIFIRSYLEENHIAPGKVEILNLGPGDFIAALLKKEIDGFAWLGPETRNALKVVKGSGLLQDGTKGYVVNHIILSAPKNLLADNRDGVVKVVQALLDAQEMTLGRPAEAAADVVHITGMKESQARDDIDRIHYDMTFTKDFRQEMNNIIGIAYKARFIKKQTDVGSMFDTGPLATVSKKLVEGD
jgi:ABC-type nitrate/sulfonate/bicarbonate transport system substrate-binding protein